MNETRKILRIWAILAAFILFLPSIAIAAEPVPKDIILQGQIWHWVPAKTVQINGQGYYEWYPVYGIDSEILTMDTPFSSESYIEKEFIIPSGETKLALSVWGAKGFGGWCGEPVNTVISLIDMSSIIHELDSFTPVQLVEGKGYIDPRVYDLSAYANQKVKIRIDQTSGNTHCTYGYYKDIKLETSVIIPTITVTSPSNFDKWQIGSSQTIKWAYAGDLGPLVQVELLKNGITDQILAPSISLGKDGFGSFVWKIPPDKPLGVDYQIRVTSLDNPIYTGTSEGYFSVIGLTSSGSITGNDGKGIPGVLITFTAGKGIKVPSPVKTNHNGEWTQEGFLQGITYRATPSDPESSGVNYIFKPFYSEFSGPSIELDTLGLQTLSGIDLASFAGYVSTKTWQKLYKDKGYRFVVVGGWGGREKNDFAQNQLQSARCVGFKTAAYTYLSFEKLDQTGDWQVKQTLEAVGDVEKKYLAFVAVDVELYCDKFGNCWEVNVKPEDRTREAVKEVESTKTTKDGDVYLKPIIYSTNNYWTKVLGLSKITEFNYLPLWDARGDFNPSLQQNWIAYGGWEGRSSKQYMLDTTKEGVGVDLDRFDPYLFADTPTSPCKSVESSTAKGTIYLDTDSGTIENLVAVNPSDILEPLPKGVNPYYGLFRFEITGLASGGSATITLIYPDNPSKATKKYWKYGRTLDNSKDHWYSIPSTVKGDRQTITLVDGGLGDDDLVANGKIRDDGGPSIDDVPPITVINLSGTQGNSDWYISDVEVNLTASDNEEGADVNFTEYSFDNITWNTYIGPFNVTIEGTTTIYYRSVDYVENIESIKSQTINIDKTPPEAKISFNTTTKNITVYNNDTKTEASYIMLPTKNNKDDDDEEHNEGNEPGWNLRQYALQDQANNSFVLILNYKSEGKEAKAGIISLQYNNGTVITVENSTIKAEYSVDKNGSIKELGQKIKTQKDSEIEAKYSLKKNQTEIKVKTKDQKEEKETRPGLVILEILTDKGNLKYLY